ncbi:MAG: histidine--tRNA ligase [Tetrasphaera jenkinsii]|uniref:Histidine--tRNA ligase n=1 Tax=Nostocoides jenkinsii Ben 74 TaxID=1193518 RepID=A0A077M792_9MICO|nr:histidine--tRNA ligase [Tetrasphaera jenkinsii]MCI1262744.1 histidine--tRNA ligase [Tetrasphaera jenkinsii]CCI53176.1 Histidyl-tRNA synthetase [Tetrasphaera jenkinsii Ben 74]
MSKIAPISGFPEFSPAERIVEQRFLDVIRETFELHGFCSIETRSIEPITRLSSQGEDADKEIYTISRLAGRARDDSKWGLHFDLTVPFARYVLENAGTLDFPFRRYQIQKSWRGERPQEGRYREFTQADIDVVDVGTLAPHFEAEMPLVIADVFQRFPVGDFVIQVNNRKLANGFFAGLGLTDVAGTLRTIDKLDKIGPEAVRELLLAGGATPAAAQACLDLAAIATDDLSFVDRVRALGVDHPDLDEGIESLAAVIETARANAPGKVVAALKIARGLDYYTGTVYETSLRGHESWGAVCSGGRYDALASDGKTTYPGVGMSIGVTRILGLLFGSRMLRASRATPTAVLVAVTNEDDRPASTSVATALRANGIPCEVAPRADRFGKQIRYADRRGIPFVWFPGAEGGQVKDIRSGVQEAADAATWRPPAADLAPSILRD